MSRSVYYDYQVNIKTHCIKYVYEPIGMSITQLLKRD